MIVVFFSFFRKIDSLKMFRNEVNGKMFMILCHNLLKTVSKLVLNFCIKSILLGPLHVI